VFLYEELFRILTEHKLEREQKIDEAGDGQLFALSNLPVAKMQKSYSYRSGMLSTQATYASSQIPSKRLKKTQEHREITTFILHLGIMVGGLTVENAITLAL